MTPILSNETWLVRFATHLLARLPQLSALEAAHGAMDESVSCDSDPNAAAAMYADVSTPMSRYQSQEQGQQRVEYWRWRIFDEARNRWNDTQHLMTETDALLHHRRATKIEGSREVRDLSEPDEGPYGDVAVRSGDNDRPRATVSSTTLRASRYA